VRYTLVKLNITSFHWSYIR